MHQLVGSTCVHCQKKIGSIIEGRFCPQCGNAVHTECMRPETDARGAAPCRGCGCDFSRTPPLPSSEAGRQSEARQRRQAPPAPHGCGPTSTSGLMQQRDAVSPSAEVLAERGAGVLVGPNCGRDTTSLKCYKMGLLVCFLGGAAYDWRYELGCPRCIRWKLLKFSLINVLTANVVWPLIILPITVSHLIGSFLSGHSPRVERYISQRKHQVAEDIAAAIRRETQGDAGCVSPWGPTVPLPPRQ